MKKIISILLALVMVISTMPFTLITANAANLTGYYYDSGNSFSTGIKGGIQRADYTGFASSKGYVIEFDYNPGTGLADGTPIFCIGDLDNTNESTKRYFEVSEGYFHYGPGNGSGFWVDNWGSPFSGLTANTFNHIMITAIPNGATETLTFYTNGTASYTTSINNSSYFVSTYLTRNHEVGFGRGCGHWGTAGEGAISDFIVYPYENYTLAEARTAANSFEQRMDGKIYTHIGDAYNAYVSVNKYLDAYNYGKNTTADYQTATRNLVKYTHMMEEWSAYTGTATVYWEPSSDDYCTKGYKNLLFYDGTYSSDSIAAGSGNNVSANMYYATAAMLWDGDDAYMPVVAKAGGGGYFDGSRSLYTLAPCDTNTLSNKLPQTFTNFYCDTWNSRKSGGTVDWSYQWEQTTVTVNGVADSTDQRYCTNATPFMASRLHVKSTIAFTDNNGYSKAENIYWYFRSYQNQNYYNNISGSDANVTSAASNKTYVVNYASLLSEINSFKTSTTKNKLSSVASYKQGGLQSVCDALNKATLNPNNYFVGATKTNVATCVNNCADAIKQAKDAMYNSTNPVADSGYTALRSAIDYEGVIDGVGDNVTYSVRNLGDNLNTVGFDTQKFNNFKDTYQTAYGLFADPDMLYTQNQAAADAAVALKTAFNALTLAQIVVEAPTFDKADGTYLGPNDTVTLTNNDSVATVTVTGTSANVGTIAANSAKTFAPFNGSTASNSVTLTATADNDGNEKTTIITYNLLKAPAISATSTSPVAASTAITISTNNSGLGGTIQYSYDGTTWVDGTSVTPFAAGSPYENNFVVNLYAREIKGSSTSAVNQVTLHRAESFDVYAQLSDSSISTSNFDDGSVIYIQDTTRYTDPVYYILIVDGVTSAITQYNPATGIAIPDGANVVKVTAFSSNDASNLNLRVAEGTFLKGDYDTLIYHESFTGASISGSAFTTGNKDGLGISGSLHHNGTAEILSGYAKDGFDANGNSADYRNNVLKVSASPSGEDSNYIRLASNPLADTQSAIVSQANGVTISFWRAYPEDVGANTWQECFAFKKADNYDNNRGKYYYFTVNGTGVTGFNHGDGAGVTNTFYDYFPEMQDPTTHAAGNTTYHWMHVAVTIDPSAGITVYTNGEPHEFNYTEFNSALHSRNCDNNGALAQEIIEFLTENDTVIHLVDGDPYNRNQKDTYLDDIRIYAEAKTQVEINNMYTDEYSDYNTERSARGLSQLQNSVGHDPTAVTVYTLAGGTYTSTDGQNRTVTEAAGKTVGQEFVDYYGIDIKNKSQVTAIDYYIFGTGMTIYHSRDNVNWEVVGDQYGRCGYQNEQLYGGVYTVAIKEQLDYARHASGGHSGQPKEPSSGAGYLQWAPHVMYNINADCWQYYGSTSSWGAMDSCIFTGNSQSIVGPYENIKTVFASCATYMNSSTPGNAIDSCVYYAHNADGSINPDKMYMLYGSWQPTYVMELDPTTGQNIYFSSDDPYGAIRYGSNTISGDYHYYGKVICAANPESEGGGSGEGGFMIYQKHNDGKGYYYFYVSLGSNYGNYNLRVFRSEYPDRGFVNYYGDDATSTTPREGHGMSFLSSYYIPIYDFVYTSVGHNSAYKAVNNNGDIVTVDSVHARTFSTTASKKGISTMEDGGLITRQSDLTGNISIQNLIAYTSEGWQVAFPLQYNGTDTTAKRFTAKDIEGIYVFNDLLRHAEYNYSAAQKLTIVAKSATQAIIYTDASQGSVNQTLTLSYGTDYAGQPITYFETTGTGGTFQGVIAQQTIDGKAVTEFSYYSKEWHGFTWGYRESDLPNNDLESDGDAISDSGIIYTHKAGDTFAKYGQEISDDFLYRTSVEHMGERYTTIVARYPDVIETDDSSAIYCLSDEELVKQGYTGGSFKVRDINGYWEDETGTKYYTEAAARAAYNQGKVLTKTYGLYGFVSNYFAYGNGENGGYPETGVKLVVQYTNAITGESFGEYQFLYVMPNPVVSHTLIGMRNTHNGGAFGADARLSTLIYSRFAGSYGSVNQTVNSVVRDPFGTTYDSTGIVSSKTFSLYVDKNDDAYTAANTARPVLGTGSFNYAGNFGNEASLSYEYTNPKNIKNSFTSYELSEGINAGSFASAEHSNHKDNAYTMTSAVVDTDYYIDYSDTELYDYDHNGDNLINVDNNGKPVNYSFEFVASNLKWNPRVTSKLSATSYYRNETGLSVTTRVDKYDSNNSVDWNTQFNGWSNEDTLGYGSPPTNYGRRVMSSEWRNESSDNDYKTGLNKAFQTMDTGHSANNAWQGTIRFTGRNSVAKNTNTSSAEEYANFVFEKGSYGSAGSSYFGGEEIYAYYNIGVHTCDKGAVREFVDLFCNKTMTVCDSDNNPIPKEDVAAYIKSGQKVGAIIPGGEIDSGLYTVASYNEYLDAIAKAYYFVENPRNTTYVENGVTKEYSVAYGVTPDNQEHAMIYTDDVGSNIFGEAGAHTDPVQSQIILDIMTAYSNLFTITDYQNAENLYNEAKITIADLLNNEEGQFTQTSIDAWNGFKDGIKEYYNYYLDRDNPVEGEDYWRYVELTGSEYRELEEAVNTMRSTLMPVVETEVLEGNIATRKQDLKDNIGTVSFESWEDIYNETVTAQGYIDDSEVEVNGFLPGKYAVTGTGTYTYGGTDYTYQTFDDDTYSDLQSDIYDEDGADGILMSKEFDRIDDEEAYTAYKSIYTVMMTEDCWNKYNPAYVDEIQEELESTYSEVFTTFTSDQAEIINDFFNEDVVDEHTEYGRTKQYDTDPITARLMAYNTTINSDQKAKYIKQFKAVMTSQVGDDEGTLQTGAPQNAYYGETFTFTEPTLSSGQYVKWSVSNYDYGVDVENLNASTNPNGSTKVNSPLTTFTRIADSNIVAHAQILGGTAGDTIVVNIYNGYGRLVEVRYVNDSSFTAQGNVTPEKIPFYNFTGWKNQTVKDENKNVVEINLYPMYSPVDLYTFVAPDGTISQSSANYNKKITLDGSEISNFYAWASKINGKYSVASYNKVYNFYAYGNEEFVPITKESGVYKINGEAISADDFVVDTTFNYAAQYKDAVNETYMDAIDFITYKLDKKYPFVQIVNKKYNSEDNKYYAYCRISEGASYTGCTMTMDNGSATYTGNITNILTNGQFYAATRSDVTFKANIIYDYELTFDGSNTNTNNTSTSISVTDSSATV